MKSQARRMLAAVARATRCLERELRRALVLWLAACLMLGPTLRHASAAPALDQVVKGTVTLEQEGTDTTINATNGSIADYRSFDIEADETVRVLFQAATDRHLGRVTSFERTFISGELFSNGHVYLVNPAGVTLTETGTVDAAGFHAAAGDADLDLFELKAAGGNTDRFSDLKELVENLGTITAEVVQLVGKHVLNSGTIITHEGQPGFFALVAGSDVTIIEQGGQIGIKLEGLAGALLEAMDPEEVPAVSIDATSVINAGRDLDPEIASQVVLGAGDLFGVAIEFGASVEAEQIAVQIQAGKADVQGRLVADTIDLCAGRSCAGGALEVAFDDAADRGVVVIGAGASLEPLSDGENLALALRQEQALSVDAALKEKLSDPRFELSLASNDEIQLSESLDVASLSAHAGRDGSGDLTVGSDDPVELSADVIALRAGDGAGGAGAAAKVTVGGNVALRATGGVAGGARSFSLRQDAAIERADQLPSKSQFGVLSQPMAYSLQADDGRLAVDDALALEVEGDLVDLSLISADDVEITAKTLTVRSLLAHAGDADGIGNVLLGEEGQAGTIRADEITLHAGRDGASGASGSSVIRREGVTFRATDGSAPERFTLQQDATISDADIPTLEIDLAKEQRITLQSDAGSVTLETAAKVAGSILTLGGRPSIGPLDSSVVIVSDLDVASLRVTSGVTLRGSVEATSGDLEFEDVVLDAAQKTPEGDPERVDQSLTALQGQITVHGKLGKRDGALILEAEPLVPDSIDLDDDVEVNNGRLEINSGFSAAGALKTFQTDAAQIGSAELGIELNADGVFDGADEGPQVVSRGTLLVASGVTISPATSEEAEVADELALAAAGDLTVDGNLVADVIDLCAGRTCAGLAPDPLLAEAERGVIMLGADASFSRPPEVGAENLALSIRQDRSLSVDAVLAAKLSDAGFDLSLASNDDIALSADLDVAALSAHAGVDGTGSLMVGSADTIVLSADEIALRAGDGTDEPVVPDDEADPADPAETTLANVSIERNVEFRATGGVTASERSFSLRQDAAIERADQLPSLSQFGVLSQPMAYTLQADDGRLTVDDALAGEVEGDMVDLSLISADDVEITARTLTVRSLLAHAANGALPVVEPDEGDEEAAADEIDPPGNVLLGVDSAETTINADAITLHAGNAGATGDSGSSLILRGTVAFRATDGSAPEIFTLQQDATISDEGIPALELDPAKAQVITLQSDAGSVTLQTAGKVTGSDLTLSGAAGVTIDLPTLELGSLQVSGAAQVTGDVNATEGDLVFTGPLELAAPVGQSLTARDRLELAGPVKKTGGSLSLAATDITVGDIDTTEADDSGGGDISINASSKLTLTGDLIAARQERASGEAARKVLLNVETEDATLEVKTELADQPLIQADEVVFGSRVFGSGVTPEKGSPQPTLRAKAFDDIAVRRDVTGLFNLNLHAGTDGSGDLIVDADQLFADALLLRAGDQVRFAEGTSLGSASDTTVSIFTLQQGIGIGTGPDTNTTATQILDRFRRNGETGEPELPNDLTLLSDNARVVVSAEEAARLRGLQLRLGGHDEIDQPGVLVEGSLETLTLELDSDTEVRGDLTTGFRQLLGTRPVQLRGGKGADIGGDLTVIGDLTLYRKAELNGSEEQTILVTPGDPDPETGEAPAPSVAAVVGFDKRSPGSGNLSVNVDGTLRLLGSIENRGGDLEITAPDLELAGRDAQRISATGSIELQHDGPLVKGRGDLEISSTDGTKLSDRGIDQTAVQVQEGDLQIEGAFESPGNLLSSGNMRLLGKGALGAGDRLLDAGGELRTTGGLAWSDGTLALRGADGVALGGDLAVVEGRTGTLQVEVRAETVETTRVLADEVTFEAGVTGPGSLDVDARSGEASFFADVTLEDSAAFSVRSRALQGIVFAKDPAAGTQLVRAGSISLNSQGHQGAPVATIVRDGDISFHATAGDFEMGRGEKLTVLGDATIQASNQARLGDVTALELDVVAPSVVLLDRPRESRRLPDGTSAVDRGTDLVANHIRLSGELSCEGGLCRTATQDGTGNSDSISGDDVQLRLIFPDGRAMRAEDLVDSDGVLLDGAGSGPVRTDLSRAFHVDVPTLETTTVQELQQLNVAAVTARPLWAEEFLEFLERGSLVGDVGQPFETRDPRLEGAAAQTALRIYRSLYAPTARYDQATAERAFSSHRPRVREALASALEQLLAEQGGGGAVSGEQLAAFLASHSRHGEALFYLSSLADLCDAGREAGLAPQELERFKRLLAEEIAPDGLTASQLAGAIRSQSDR